MVNPLQMSSLGTSGLSALGAPSSGGIPGLGGGGLSIPGMSGGISGLTSFSGMSGIGGGAPGLDAASLKSQGVASSTLMLMAQINTMMASVMTGLMAFMQQLMASNAARQQQQAATGATGATPGATGSTPGATGGSPATGGGPNTMTPPSSSGGITKLSDNKDERLRQVVDAAKRMFPNQPHLAKLAAAQAVLESGLTGNPSSLASQHNNLFGIKGKGTAGTVNLGTQEEEGGAMVSTTAGFAKNATLEDSFKQHRDLLTGNSRYAKVVSATSFEQAAQEVRAAGYATDSSYPQKLISIYNSQLAQYF